MKVIVISDDLSGAAGMASMLGMNIPIIPFNRIEIISERTEMIVSIDLETRNSTDELVRLKFIEKNFSEYKIFTRIDTMLRGSTSTFIEFMALYYNIAITDTVPEYRRYTSEGFTFYQNERIDIGRAIPTQAKHKAKIFNSRTYDDLSKISRKCMDENMVPVDPGPLIAVYLRMML